MQAEQAQPSPKKKSLQDKSTRELIGELKDIVQWLRLDRKLTTSSSE